MPIRRHGTQRVGGLPVRFQLLQHLFDAAAGDENEDESKEEQEEEEEEEEMENPKEKFEEGE